jgi:hypothetical protein
LVGFSWIRPVRFWKPDRSFVILYINTTVTKEKTLSNSVLYFVQLCVTKIHRKVAD